MNITYLNDFSNIFGITFFLRTFQGLKITNYFSRFSMTVYMNPDLRPLGEALRASGARCGRRPHPEVVAYQVEVRVI